MNSQAELIRLLRTAIKSAQKAKSTEKPLKSPKSRRWIREVDHDLGFCKDQIRELNIFLADVSRQVGGIDGLITRLAAGDIDPQWRANVEEQFAMMHKRISAIERKLEYLNETSRVQSSSVKD